MRFLRNALQFACIVSVFVAVGSIVPEIVFQCYTWIATIFLCFSMSMWILEIIQDCFFAATVGTKNKAVLITGCDTGFGNAMARILDGRGYKVFACCLNKGSEGASDLTETCSEKLSIIQMDVTDDESVNDALKSVENQLGNSELWAVINNAGVLKGFQTELSRMKDYEMCIQVNTLGTIRVSKAFLPLLRKSKGRLINVCSLAGRQRAPFMGAYMTSKSAAVAFTEVLKQEMREFGVRVISIEPEFFGTQMCSEEYVMNSLKEACSEVDEEVKYAYGIEYIEEAQRVFWGIFSRHSPDVKRVYDAIESAVSLETPADIYRPMRNIFIKMLFMLVERLPVVFIEQAIILIFFMMGLPTPKTGVNVIKRFLKM